jgi:serine protease
VAVTGNLTVTGQTSAGYAYIGPQPLADPPSSTLNFPWGDTRANGLTVALGPGGALSATYGYAGATHLVFDVTGYFRP